MTAKAYAVVISILALLVGAAAGILVEKYIPLLEDDFMLVCAGDGTGRVEAYKMNMRTGQTWQAFGAQTGQGTAMKHWKPIAQESVTF